MGSTGRSTSGPTTRRATGTFTSEAAARADEINILVTDSTADRAELDRIAAAGVEIHVVEV